MVLIDWIIVIIYILLLIVMSFNIGRAQENQEDYYLGGKRIPPWQVGTSMVENQVSAISLIGAPAFIAVNAFTQLFWLLKWDVYGLGAPCFVLNPVLTPRFPTKRSQAKLFVLNRLFKPIYCADFNNAVFQELLGFFKEIVLDVF